MTKIAQDPSSKFNEILRPLYRDAIVDFSQLSAMLKTENLIRVNSEAYYNLETMHDDAEGFSNFCSLVENENLNVTVLEGLKEQGYDPGKDLLNSKMTYLKTVVYQALMGSTFYAKYADRISQLHPDNKENVY